ncbi:DUF481 domain-containing protein [Hymenobacter jeollabukensis]|uniref:DUF481 domain-containing protein n=1 Tax=Hymenobacter jeollabukensis TaxID=2025313 RepID=A0A5R8WN29_9BACT|nr:DUF481 domain-containing protein [Hymenobacter jeollabukensis]TLM91115.1 DUF481 domain-containing protein [Hymenobacter jeollabukensis]
MLKICHRFFLFSLLLLAAHAARAQRPDTTIIHYTSTLTGALSAGGVYRTLLTTTHSVSFNRGLHFGLPVTGTFTYGKQDRQLKEREILANTTPYYWKGHFRAYGLGGYERSNLRGIADRWQVGTGPGWSFYRDSLGTREVALSNLLIREATYYVDGSERVVTRNSLRLKLLYTLRQFTVSTFTFYQPSIPTVSDFRVSQLATVTFKVTKRLAVNATSNYTHESRVLAGKNPDNYNLTVGFSYATP